MTRFEQQQTPLIYFLIVFSGAAVFTVDLLTPLGIAEWVMYLLPMMLSLFVWRPAAPLWIAGSATALTALGFWLSPAGVDQRIGIINRGLGVLTIWIVAAISCQFIRNRLMLRTQEWFQSGRMRLSEAMEGDQPLHTLGESILRVLCDCLDAHAAAAFFEDDGIFHRFAASGISPDSSVPERFASGTGLLGRAAEEGRSIVIHDVPEGYFTVGSALGASTARHLMIAPTRIDGTVNGVIELAFMHPVYESDIELLGLVSESMAAAIRSARYRVRQQELLEETQRQAEELQVQSEELRAANEKLSEQSRTLHQSQQLMERQQAELEQTNQQLEEQTQALEAQRDELSLAKASLVAQTQELEQASRYKSDFLANMSHELRTPLNSSLILAKLLADNRQGNLTPEQVRHAETIQSAGNDLLALINDILDISKIEAGRMEVRIQKTSLARMLDGLDRGFRPMAEEKGLRFTLHVGEGVPEQLETDPQRLEQVLKNLLSNAIKFTPRGEVALEIRQSGSDRVAFSVRDTGIGIPAHQRTAIFDPFLQADSTANRKYGGTGLGLSISRELVRLLGGEIQLASEVGEGSEFTATIPQALPATATAAQAGAPQPRVSPRTESRLRNAAPRPAAAGFQDDRERLTADRRAILVIEDDPSFARILSDLAHEMGFDCLSAATSEEGIRLAMEFLPSAVVLDIGMPDNTGLSVLDRIKKDARTRHIPVHIVSVSDHTQRALSMGAAGYLLKPVAREELVRAFEQLKAGSVHRMRRVLVVEDDPVQLDSLKRLLESEEVAAIGAASAAECLQKLSEQTFDCMVLDLNLPDATGFSLLEKLGQDACGFPPVVVYTGRELSGEEEQELRMRSQSIIIKGVRSPERLLDEVTLFLHQVVSELPIEQQRILENVWRRDAALEGKRILVAEDDVRNVFALTSVLEPRGAAVTIARNGREAIAALEKARRTPEQAIDLVLMDIMMPEMDGIAAIESIRRDAEWRKLPIIALTAKAMPDDQERCLAAGANDYIAKPLDVEKLLSLIRVWMRQ